MELLYNPDVMPEDEIKATFVAREAMVDELVALIEHQPDGAGVQHVVVIAPRGMGKTTLLRMVIFAIRDRGLTDQWQAVKFPEESYGITDLADFWIQVLVLLATETGDDELGRQAEGLKTTYPNNDDLQGAALAMLKDWRRRHNKRLVLLVENFDSILEQINDERDNARLRDVLMNDGMLMLMGGSTTFFREARAYDQPLYNFFKILNLPELKEPQIHDLLRQRGAIDGISDFEKTLAANRSRLRALEHFTGGNPRLVLMLYRVVTQSDVTNVGRGLEKLLDEVTPYYKAKVECLPPQQRKIVDHIACVSGETNEGLTPGDIAQAVRLKPNQVSAQLKRLSDLGYVRPANLRGRSSHYALSEPLYAIWHQMRFGRDARQRMRWLVNFLKIWYAGDESEPWEVRNREYLRALSKLHEAGYIDEEQLGKAKKSARDKAFAAAMGLATAEFRAGNHEDALRYLDQAIEIKPDDHEAWYNRGLVLGELERDKEAVASYDQVVELKPDVDAAWYNRGNALMLLGRYEEAVVSYDRAVELKPDKDAAWYNRGLACATRCGELAKLNNLDLARWYWNDALSSWKQAEKTGVPSLASEALLAVARTGSLNFVRQLIAESNLEEPLFPLARAIDYLESGDEALIEKLSPEVRSIVKEVVNTLSAVSKSGVTTTAERTQKKPAR